MLRIMLQVIVVGLDCHFVMFAKELRFQVWGWAIGLYFAWIIDVFYQFWLLWKKSGHWFFQFEIWKSQKIPNEIFSEQNDPKSWGTISDVEKKMSTKNKAIPLISYGDMRLLIVWW